MVNGVNITLLPEEKFNHVCQQVHDAGMQVSCLGHAIANWARPISIDPQVDIDDLKGAIPAWLASMSPIFGS